MTATTARTSTLLISDSDVRKIRELIEKAWTRETSVSPDIWTTSKPSVGQCAVTALIIQDCYGGDLVRGEMNDGTSHYWNQLPNGSEIDLTKDQFDESEIPQNVKIVDRPRVISNPDTVHRYHLLLKNIGALGGIGILKNL